MEARLTGLDYAIVVGYIVFAMGVGVLLAKRAAQSIAQYFAAGRELPWWIAAQAWSPPLSLQILPSQSLGLSERRAFLGTGFGGVVL